MSIRRAVAALLLSVVATVAVATPALAHAEPIESSSLELIGSSPKPDSLLASPQLVMLSFNKPVTLAANPITITAGNGASWTLGQPKITGPVVTAPVLSRGPLGPYTITFNVIFDGDPITGTIAFTLISPDTKSAAKPPSKGAKPPSPASSTASPAVPHGGSHLLPGAVSDTVSTSDSGGIPAWVWIIGAVVVLAIGLLEAFRMGRSGRS